MEARVIRGLTDDEIRQRLDESYETMFNLRFQRVVGQLENTARLGEVRRDIARLKTVLRERDLEAMEGQKRCRRSENVSLVVWSATRWTRR